MGPNNRHLLQYYEDITDGELCANLTYLGKRGLYTLTNGTKIAYISGIEKPLGVPEEDFHFQMADIEGVRNSCLINKSSASDYRGVDILLTSQWPYGITDDSVRFLIVILICIFVIMLHFFLY